MNFRASLSVLHRSRLRLDVDVDHAVVSADADGIELTAEQSARIQPTFRKVTGRRRPRRGPTWSIVAFPARLHDVVDIIGWRRAIDGFAELAIADVQSACARGEWTSAGLVERYLQRIAEIDGAGPLLRSMIELNPAALAIAEALDAERRQGRVRGPLHGVPIVVKDSIDTGDAMSTTAGSLALDGNIAPRDAHVVARLRDAGAVIVGKTNMSEWGYMRSTRPCSGWSSRGGQVRNPYVLDRSPLGSSSGSAVAVAANLCVAALGAEVDGSIVRPASSNSMSVSSRQWAW
jgi:hypothetical protein